MKQLWSMILVMLFPLLLSASMEMDIIFPHAFHVEDMGVECSLCHVGVEHSATGMDNLLPEMDTCMECHDGDTADDECGKCHHSEDNPQIAPRITTYLPKFTHAEHVENVDCELCHQGVTVSMEATSHHLPQMGLCMDCHDTPLTMQGCELCHQPQDNLTPASHAVDWVYLHAAAPKGRCAECHSEDQCEDCHTGTAGVILYHEENNLLTHGMDYLMRDTDCSVCHTGYDSCIECHQINAVKPLWHMDIDYVTGTHGAEALIDPTYCALCHGEGETDATCVECH